MKHRRRRVRVAALVLPDDRVGAGEVAVAAEPDGHQVGIAIAAHHEHQAIGGNRLRDGVLAKAARPPDAPAGLEIVADHFARGRDDHLLAAVDASSRTVPTSSCCPAAATASARARSRVERHEEGVALVVEDDEQRVVFEPCPCALAEGHEHRQRPKSFCQTSRPSIVYAYRPREPKKA